MARYNNRNRNTFVAKVDRTTDNVDAVGRLAAAVHHLTTEVASIIRVIIGIVMLILPIVGVFCPECQRRLRLQRSSTLHRAPLADVHCSCECSTTGHTAMAGGCKP